MGNVGTTTFEIVDVRYGNGNECVMHFSVPRPKTVLRRQDGEVEDLELLDEPDAEIIWSSDPNVKPYPIELEPSGRELSKIQKPPPLPTVKTR